MIHLSLFIFSFFLTIERKNLFVCVPVGVWGLLLGFRKLLKCKWGMQVKTWVYLERKGRENRGSWSLLCEIECTNVVTGSCLNLSPLWNHMSSNKPEQIIQAILQHIKGRVSRPAEESGLQCGHGEQLSIESHYQAPSFLLRYRTKDGAWS